jgi:hypothetical protein
MEGRRTCTVKMIRRAPKFSAALMTFGNSVRLIKRNGHRGTHVLTVTRTPLRSPLYDVVSRFGTSVELSAAYPQRQNGRIRGVDSDLLHTN